MSGQVLVENRVDDAGHGLRPLDQPNVIRIGNNDDRDVGRGRGEFGPRLRRIDPRVV
jgi:hypothetical protein